VLERADDEERQGQEGRPGPGSRYRPGPARHLSAENFF
jgi:hypothetical protein